MAAEPAQPQAGGSLVAPLLFAGDMALLVMSAGGLQRLTCGRQIVGGGGIMVKLPKPECRCWAASATIHLSSATCLPDAAA